MKRKKMKRATRKWDCVLSIAEAVVLGYRLAEKQAAKRGRDK